MKKAANPDDLLNTEIKIVDEVTLSFVAVYCTPISKIYFIVQSLELHHEIPMSALTFFL